MIRYLHSHECSKICILFLSCIVCIYIQSTLLIMLFRSLQPSFFFFVNLTSIGPGDKRTRKTVIIRYNKNGWWWRAKRCITDTTILEKSSAVPPKVNHLNIQGLAISLLGACGCVSHKIRTFIPQNMGENVPNTFLYNCPKLETKCFSVLAWVSTLWYSH